MNAESIYVRRLLLKNPSQIQESMINHLKIHPRREEIWEKDIGNPVGSDVVVHQ